MGRKEGRVKKAGRGRKEIRREGTRAERKGSVGQRGHLSCRRTGGYMHLTPHASRRREKCRGMPERTRSRKELAVARLLLELLHSLRPTERNYTSLAASDSVEFNSILPNVFVCVRHRSLIILQLERSQKPLQHDVSFDWSTLSLCTTNLSNPGHDKIAFPQHLWSHFLPSMSLSRCMHIRHSGPSCIGSRHLTPKHFGRLTTVSLKCI
jgi:hypothetical protein